MKVDTQSKQNVENKDNTVQLKGEDAEILAAVNMPFSDILSQQLADGENSLNSSSSISNFYSLKADYNYDSLSMDLEDAVFFVNLAQEGKFSIENSPAGDFKSVIQFDVSQTLVSKKTVETTNQLSYLIEKAQSTQKPVRISFDNDVSVILKIDKQGKVRDDFIPGSLEVENYLKIKIASLRQKFDEQNLPYNDLLYRQNEKQNKNKNNKDNKGE